MIFQIDNEMFTLAEMLAANWDDDMVVEWLNTANVGDVFKEFDSETVTRIA